MGDLAETIGLLAGKGASWFLGLDQTIRKFLLPLRDLDPSLKKELLADAWNYLSEKEMLPFHKLLTGGFRMGVSKGNLCKALSRVSNQEPSRIAQRIAGDWNCENTSFAEIICPETDQEKNISRPYPFCLALPLQEDVTKLGSPDDWQVEWKWDGVRAQLLSIGGGRGMIWSREKRQWRIVFLSCLNASHIYPGIFAWMAKFLLGDMKVCGRFLTFRRDWVERCLVLQF